MAEISPQTSTIRGYVKLPIRRDSIKYIVGRTSMNYGEVIDLFTIILNKILKNVIEELDEWIDARVAKRTGQLRDNLKANLRSSRIVNNILKLIIRSDLDYAPKVDEYATSQVRHSGTDREHSGKKAYAYYYGHYGAITLDDPYAVGGFFYKMQQYAAQRIDLWLTRFREKYFRG